MGAQNWSAFVDPEPADQCSAEYESQLTIEVTTGVIRIAGELDYATGEALRRAVLPAAAWVEVVLDITALTFIDASGLGCLVRLVHEPHRSDRSLLICGASPKIARVFAIVGLSGLLDTTPQHRARYGVPAPGHPTSGANTSTKHRLAARTLAGPNGGHRVTATEPSQDGGADRCH